MNQRINKKGFDFLLSRQTENVRGWLEMYSEAVISHADTFDLPGIAF